MKSPCKLFSTLVALACASAAQSAVLTFGAEDFTVSPQFSNVTTFSFSIDMTGPLVAGGAYANPTLNSVSYHVAGTLGGTPSGFPAFDLRRTVAGAEFYAQGSSLAFTVSAAADLSDGLQVSELTGAVGAPVFVFNGREVDTGRYHPALFELYAGGSGRIQNSNNTGGINPASMEVVDVDFGAEYITDLVFDPATLSLAPPQTVPLPGAFLLFGSAAASMVALGYRRRKGTRRCSR